MNGGFKLIFGRRGAPETLSSSPRAEHFSGGAWSDLLINAPDSGVRLETTFLEPGSRDDWHQHDGGEVLIVAAGESRIATAEGGRATLRAGDVAYLSPGEWHWHGATAVSLVHFTVFLMGNVAWGNPVTDDEFGRGFDDSVASPHSGAK